MPLVLSDRFLTRFERGVGLVGLCVIVWMIYRLGPARIAANLHVVNWGFFWMFLVRGLRYLCQSAAWKLILAQEDRPGPGFWKLLRINLEGESVNYITITRIGGEPVKAVGISGDLPLGISAASVIVLKFSNIFGFWLVIAVGFLAALFNADVTGEIKRGIGMGLLGLTAMLLAASWSQRGAISRPFSWLSQRFRSQRQWVAAQVLRITHLDEHIVETYRSKPLRILLAVAVNALGWCEEIFFIWLAFTFLGMRENWFLPTIVGTLALMGNAFFFFVPWRAGTQEGTMVLAFTLLNLSEPMGLSLAILRRLRELAWVFIGLTLFALETVKTQSPVLEAPPEVPPT